MTILVVDDYVQVREVMRLEGQGHSVLAAQDGAEALRLFAEREVDAAFVDMDMPVMNGLDVCRALLERAAAIMKPVRVWLMTGVMRPEVTDRAVEEALRACKQNKFDGVLTDHHLGDQNGPAFMAQLRSAGVQCPVVMVTASSDPKIHARAYAAGASRVFYGSKLDFTGYFRRMLPATT